MTAADSSQRPSLRSQRLNQITNEPHAKLDALVKAHAPFETQANFARFVVAQYLFQSELVALYNDAELIKIVPDLAERCRAGGAGIPAFYTKTGVGTLVAEGKELREFGGETYVMEHALFPEVALIKADVADMSGNLRFNLTARNFNPAAATAGKICIVEVERIVATGEIAPDDVHLPGIYVHRIVHNPTPEKRIEKRTTRDRK